MTFHLHGDQHANQITFVGRDQYNWRGHGVFAPEPARNIAFQLRRSVEQHTRLDRQGAQAARDALDEIDAGLRPAQPEVGRVAGALERLTGLLTAAGALGTAGVALVDQLRTLATWLGELGAPVLALLV